MAKVLYSATMSLDGFIAGAGGDMSWMTEYLGANPAGDEVARATGSILAGRTHLRRRRPEPGHRRRRARSAAPGAGRSSS